MERGSVRVKHSELIETLHEQFQFDSFRPGQERIIRSLLAGRDVLALLPTAAGKSLVYQLTAQLLPGVTIVVSPLLALMKDQVESIGQHGLDVSVVNSMQSQGETREELAEAQEGLAKLLYVTPERFADEAFMASLDGLSVSLFVVDEAHCVSEWGHSFRPAYLGLAAAAARLGGPPMLALTATATPAIRSEIVERLGLRDPETIVRGFDRPNLFFEVRRVESEDDDRRVLRALLLDDDDKYGGELGPKLVDAMQGVGIIYTATTRAAQQTAEWLQEWGIAADYYHGQRKKADRTRVQEAFMAGELRVIAATNAFGLGVDKADVRWVIHRDIPGSLEAYYQEAGRAGRDGEFARCAIIYRPADLGRAAFLSGGGRLTREEVRQAHAGLVANPEASLADLPEITGLGKGDLLRLVTILQGEGVLEERDGHVRLLVPDFDPDQVPLEGEAHRIAYERSRLEMMRGYAEAGDCRRRYILNYFGEEPEAERCAMCDNDLPREAAHRVVITEEQVVESSFALGDRVVHEKWGEGVVQRVAADTITVLFDTAGYKALATELVQERELLKPAP